MHQIKIIVGQKYILLNKGILLLQVCLLRGQTLTWGGKCVEGVQFIFLLVEVENTLKVIRSLFPFLKML